MAWVVRLKRSMTEVVFSVMRFVMVCAGRQATSLRRLRCESGAAWE
jgi:hypothetical protein